MQLKWSWSNSITTGQSCPGKRHSKELSWFIVCVRDWPEISSVHDGHHQTQLCLGLEGVSQRHDESTVNSSQDPFLYHSALRTNNTSVTDDLQLHTIIRFEKLCIFTCALTFGLHCIFRIYFKNLRILTQNSLYTCEPMHFSYCSLFHALWHMQDAFPSLECLATDA